MCDYVGQGCKHVGCITAVGMEVSCYGVPSSTFRPAAIANSKGRHNMCMCKLVITGQYIIKCEANHMPKT